MRIEDLVREARQSQGWRVDETKKGWLFFSPFGGSPVAARRRPTEQGLKKTLNQLKARGFRWPPKG